MPVVTTSDDVVRHPLYQIPNLPLSCDIESKRVLRKAGEARSALAESKGITAIIPNQSILMNTLTLQEAKDSSAIENIITTQDELYKSDTSLNHFATHSAKEVHRYASALKNGYLTVKESGLLTNSLIKELQAYIEGNDAGLRNQAGTSLKNE